MSSPLGTRWSARFANLYASSAARDGLWVLGAQGLSTFVTLLAEGLLFHTLTKGDLGTLTAALALHAVLLQLADLGLALTTIRVGSEFVSKHEPGMASAVFRRAFQARALLCVVVAGGAALLAPALARFPIAQPDQTGLVFAAAANLLGTSLVWWSVDVAQARRRFAMYFTHQVLSAVLKAGVMIAVLAAFDGGGVSPFYGRSWPEAVLWGLAIANLAAGIVSVSIHCGDLRASAELVPEAKRALNAYLLDFGKYACVATVLTGLGAQVEIVLIQNFSDSHETAVFACARRLGLVLPLLATAFLTVLLPRASALRTRAECGRYVRKALLVSVPVAALAAGGMAALAGVLVPLFGSAQYMESVPILRWLCLGHAFTLVLTPLALVMYPLRQERATVILGGLNLALSVGLGCWLVPRHGALGAAISALCGKIVVAAVTVAMIVRVFRQFPEPSPPTPEDEVLPGGSMPPAKENAL